MTVQEACLDMVLQPFDDGGIGINLAHASHVSTHSQQMGVTSLQLWGAGPSAAVVFQQEAQAVQALTGALTQGWCLVYLAQQAPNQELAPLKGFLKAFHHACM